MPDFKVAIWMVTYNHEAYIEQAIESVMAQKTSFPFKLFIGEDCSSDETKSICKKLSDKYPDTIELVVNTTNLGPTQNAFQIYDLCLKSEAKYIALLEGDDYWTDTLKLQKQVDFLETNTEYTFSLTRFLTYYQDSTKEDKNAHFFIDETNLVYNFDMFTKGWYGGTLTLLFRATAFNLSEAKNYSHFRDVHLYTMLLKKGHGVCQNFTSAVYRKHDDGVYSSASNLQRAEIAVLCYQELFTNNDSILALKIKYKYFAASYITQLINNGKDFSAIKEIMAFALRMKDFKFAKKNDNKIDQIE